jgi:serine/threonine protein kinase
LKDDSGRITIENICSECGQSFSSETKLCPNDGTRLVAPPAEKKKPKNGSSTNANTKPLLKVAKIEPTDSPLQPADSNPAGLSAGSLFAQALQEPLHLDDKNISKDDESTRQMVQQFESPDGSEPAGFALEAAQRLIGKIVNEQYQIISAIGYGGMSVVFKAKDLKLGKFVAIKMLLPHLMLQSHNMQRFQQEAQSASALNHPNVVAIHNYGETETGQPFLVMDLIEGTSLSSLIKKEGHLPVDRALNIFLQLTSALTHAHEHGVVHRDLKPSNILLCEQNGETDICKIVDFGIAKLLPHEGRDAVSLTQTGDVFGSPLYMSPEQCKGEKLDQKSDIYSMGCLMYETLSGNPPHAGNNMLEVLYRHMNEVPKDFKSLKLGIIIPQRLEAAIFKALAKEPANRQQSMQALQDELRQIQLFRKGSLIGRISTSWELFVLKRRPRKRSEFIMAGALAVSLVGLLAAMVFLFSQYAFADESQVFKQTLDWKITPPPAPVNAGATAASLFQTSVDKGNLLLKEDKNRPREEYTQSIEQLTLWAGRMADSHHWEEASKAYAMAMELSKKWNSELSLPTFTLRRLYADAAYHAGDYAFSAREFTIYQQQIKNFLYGEATSDMMKGVHQTAESYYYLKQYSDAITAYRNFFASMRGEGMEWTNWGPREIGRYLEVARDFQNTEEYALILSHFADCLQHQEVLPKAKDTYKAAAARWKTLKKSDNAALAYLKAAAIDEALNQDPKEDYESALNALKPDGSNFATCIIEKKYADYLWKNGGVGQAILLKLDYSRLVPKVKL